MAGGRQNSIAVTTGGEVYTWGENVYGQLGDGTISSTGRNTPAKVAGARQRQRRRHGPGLRHGDRRAVGQPGSSQTETCFVLSLVNGSRFQPLQRSRSVIPASCAIRSSSAGQT